MTTPRGVSAPPATAWVGWIAFAAAIMIMAGIFNAINGLAAIFSDDVFVAGEENIVVLDLTSWGWIHLVLGALIVATGVALMTGAMWARVIGTILVMLNMATQLVFLPAYPFWSTLIIALDILVLWAIVVHGSEAKSL